jgi:hypothetical protein
MADLLAGRTAAETVAESADEKGASKVGSRAVVTVVP